MDISTTATPVYASPVQQLDPYRTVATPYNNTHEVVVSPARQRNTPNRMRSRPRVEQNVPRGEWTDSELACFNNISPSLICAIFCPCIMLGQITEKMRTLTCWSTCCGYWWFFFAMFIIIGSIIPGIPNLIWWSGVSYFIFNVRVQFRSQYELPEYSPTSECIMSCFCQPCAISQMARHLYQYSHVCDSFSFRSDGEVHRAQGEEDRVLHRPPQPRHAPGGSQPATATAAFATATPSPVYVQPVVVEAQYYSPHQTTQATVIPIGSLNGAHNV